MALTIDGNYLASSDSLSLKPSGTLTNFFNASGQRNSNGKLPAFNASGIGGWYYASQMGGASAEWIDGTIGAGTNGQTWAWQVTQTGAGSYGFDGGRYYAPVTGRYYFYTSTYMYCDTNSTNCYIHFMFGKNGDRSFNNGRPPYSIYGHGAHNNYIDGIVHSTEIDLNEGQYISILPTGQRQNSRTHGNHCLFAGCLMG
jgi:hypothetical protein